MSENNQNNKVEKEPIEDGEEPSAQSISSEDISGGGIHFRGAAQVHGDVFEASTVSKSAFYPDIITVPAYQSTFTDILSIISKFDIRRAISTSAGGALVASVILDGTISLNIFIVVLIGVFFGLPLESYLSKIKTRAKGKQA